METVHSIHEELRNMGLVLKAEQQVTRENGGGEFLQTFFSPRPEPTIQQYPLRLLPKLLFVHPLTDFKSLKDKALARRTLYSSLQVRTRFRFNISRYAIDDYQHMLHIDRQSSENLCRTPSEVGGLGILEYNGGTLM